MKKWICVLAMVASGLMTAQDGPSGEDINSAVPIWFGQKVNDIVDANLRQFQVYSIPLARGQRFTSTVRVNGDPTCFDLKLFGPAKRTVAGSGFDTEELRESPACKGVAATWTYEVPAADEVNIGGTRSHITDKLETAMKSGINVEACHDSQGQIFQVKLQR